MNICVPTTPEEWGAAEEEDGPFLMAADAHSVNTPDGANVPMWVSTNTAGEAESFLTLDGALLWALGMIDVRDTESHRMLFDRHGAAIPFFENLRRKLDAKAKEAKTED